MANNETRLGIESDSVYLEKKVTVDYTDGYLSIIMPKTLTTDHTAIGKKAYKTAAESLVFGDVCYINSNGKMAKADADAIASAGAVFLCLGSYSADADGKFLVSGLARDDNWNWTPGAWLFVSTTAGALTETAPSATDDVIKPAAMAWDADHVMFGMCIGGVEHT